MAAFVAREYFAPKKPGTHARYDMIDVVRLSMNQFFVTAIAEKVSALKTEAYFRERQARGNLSNFDAWLDVSPETPPMTGDELG